MCFFFPLGDVRRPSVSNRRGSDLESDDSDEWATDSDDEDQHAGDVAIARAASPRRLGKRPSTLGRTGLAPLDTNLPPTRSRALRSSKAMSRWWQGDSPTRHAVGPMLDVPSRRHLAFPAATDRPMRKSFWKDGTGAALSGAAPAMPHVKAHRPPAQSVSVQQLDGYAYAMAQPQTTGLKSRHLKPSVRKMRFVKHELLADLALGTATSLTFWIQVILLIIAFYLRIYVHYLGQWLYLRALRVPVFDFRPTPYSAVLKYVADSLPTEYEIGMVTIGHLSVLAVFAVLMAFAWACQKVGGHYPTQL